MKRTLSVMLVVGCLMIVWLRMRLGTPQPMLAMEEARAAQERVRVLSDAQPAVSLPGGRGGAGSANLVEVPTDETPNRETLPPLSGNNVGSDVVGDDRPAAVPTNEAVVDGATELKVFCLQSVDASDAIRVIQPLFPRDAKFSLDQRTNTLFVSANADRLAVVTALLQLLDQEPAKKRLPLPAKSDALRDDRLPNTSPTSWPVNIPAPKNDQDAAMDRESKQLATRVRAAKEPEKSKLRAELEVLTEKHFELRQQRRKQEIDDMADRVDKLRVAHHRRQESKPDILKHRLADLLDEENELKWDEARLKPTSPITPSLAQLKADPQLPNLEGEWLVTLPAGFEFVGKIEKQPEGCWSFQDMRNLSGYYQIEGSTLKAVTTDPKKSHEYEWLILNDKVMVLTKAPQKDGHDYRGATLRRGAKPKKPVERTSLPDFGDDPVSNSETGSSRTAVIRAAHRKAAEARLRLAKFELDRVVEINRKVPGSVSSSEVEKLATNVSVAEAELELAGAGVDPHGSKPRGGTLSEPVAAAKLQKAEVVLKSAKTEFDRMQKLVESKSASSAELDRVTALVEEAKADVDIAKAELEEARRATQPTPGK